MRVSSRSSGPSRPGTRFPESRHKIRFKQLFYRARGMARLLPPPVRALSQFTRAGIQEIENAGPLRRDLLQHGIAAPAGAEERTNTAASRLRQRRRRGLAGLAGGAPCLCLSSVMFSGERPGALNVVECCVTVERLLPGSAGILAGANFFHTAQHNRKQHAGRDAGAPRR